MLIVNYNKFMRNKLLLAVTIFMSTNIYAFTCEEKISANTSCESSTHKQEIETIIKSLIYSDNAELEMIDSSQSYQLQTSFDELIPEYEQNRIIIREFENDEYYLKTMFKLKDIFKRNRRMYIDINKKLYQCAPNKSALIAILAHELKHIIDYKRSTFIKIAGLGFKMIFKKSRSKYERETDLFVLENHMSKGLSLYREWIYKNLNSKQLKTKKCFYFTPIEIEQYVNTAEDSMQSYFKDHCR